MLGGAKSKASQSANRLLSLQALAMQPERREDEEETQFQRLYGGGEGQKHREITNPSPSSREYQSFGQLQIFDDEAGSEEKSKRSPKIGCGGY